MTGWLGVAVYCVAVVALVLGVVWWADWSLAHDDRRRAARRARSVFPQQTWAWTPDFEPGEPDPDRLCGARMHHGPDSIFCSLPAGHDGWHNHGRADWRDLDHEYDLELHVAEAMRIANGDER